jgi:hypothetical protein
MAEKRVLLIGLDPALLNFSPERGPNPGLITAAGKIADERLSDLGYEVQSCLINPGAATEAPILEALAQATFDCVMIGAGLRGLLEHTILFEKVINAIHQNAPSAKLCFNTHPSDTVEAVLRWV